jgi:hypothetical protein
MKIQLSMILYSDSFHSSSQYYTALHQGGFLSLGGVMSSYFQRAAAATAASKGEIIITFFLRRRRKYTHRHTQQKMETRVCFSLQAVKK